MTISAFIEKQKLIDWLETRSNSGWWYDKTDELIASYDYAHGVREVLFAVKRGEFDWTGEGD